MLLDSEQQKAMLLEIINNLQFRGADIEKMFTLKQAVTDAEIRKDGKWTESGNGG